MEVGDLILWQDKTWLVRKIDEAVSTSFVEDISGSSAVLDQDGDTIGLCTVICSPARDWFSVMLPVKSRSRLSQVWNGSTMLTRFQDWVRVDEFQLGGQLLLNPALNLGYGDRITAVFSILGSRIRVDHSPIDIPRHFSSMTSKIARLNAPPPKEPEPPQLTPTFYDALTAEDDPL